jgi:putative tricarboxylic transport membrane protein
MFKRRDISVGVASILAAVFIILQSRGLVVRTSLDPAGPTFVPEIIAWTMILIGVALIAGGWVARKTSATGHEAPRQSLIEKLAAYRQVLLIVALSLAYAVLVDIVGYLLMTPVLIGGIMWILKVRDIKQILRVCLPVSVVLYLVFRFGLQVKLPLGILEVFIN